MLSITARRVRRRMNKLSGVEIFAEEFANISDEIFSGEFVEIVLIPL